ncbi:MAG: hypothetical protein PF638_08450 [Candidatus Delongbacteria bacterium]|jgi:hypothetical protein|nr:hypothetical protein [Candidatus Delongbacteria bacterium]
MDLKKIQSKVTDLLVLADETLATEFKNGHLTQVDNEKYLELKTGVLSFIEFIYGVKHSYYNTFTNEVKSNYPYQVLNIKGILNSIKKEIDEGWLNSLKGLVSAEIFSDFLEMAEHLLEEDYKDPAAVMTGSVLEEHLRNLCTSNLIEVTIVKNNKQYPKKADLLNSELAKEGIYDILDQKSITSWLDLRNKAAHGHYSKYTKEQVDVMLQGVNDFIERTS